MPPHLVFGAGSFGGAKDGFVYTFETPEKITEVLDVLQRLDITELDSAAGYPVNGIPGEVEEHLGQIKVLERGFSISSKVLVTDLNGGHMTDQLIAASLDRTLASLGTSKLDLYYSHFPDPLTPLEEQAKSFHKQYLAGKFERLGICNYTAEETKKFFAICEEKGYIKPSVYQGQYNALQRQSEDDLFPVLRAHNCAFYAYSPLAGGFLTGKVTLAKSDPSQASVLERTRFTATTLPGVWYGMTYDKPTMHDAIRRLKAVGDAQTPPVSTQQAAMRWLVHHSSLREGDGIVFGAKRIDQLEANVADARSGQLERELLEVVEGLWDSVKGQ